MWGRGAVYSHFHHLTRLEKLDSQRPSTPSSDEELCLLAPKAREHMSRESVSLPPPTVCLFSFYFFFLKENGLSLEEFGLKPCYGLWCRRAPEASFLQASCPQCMCGEKGGGAQFCCFVPVQASKLSSVPSLSSACIARVVEGNYPGHSYFLLL